jgi:hypothetical protein
MYHVFLRGKYQGEFKNLLTVACLWGDRMHMIDVREGGRYGPAVTREQLDNAVTEWNVCSTIGL